MSMASTAHFLGSMETVQRNIHEWAKSRGFWNIGQYSLEEPHFVSTEDCNGGPQAYWRCWARLESGNYQCGIGATAEQAKQDAKEKAEGVNQVAERIALIHSELSEALEAHRSPKPDGFKVNETQWWTDDGGVFDSPKEDLPIGKVKPEGVGIELADAVIRIMDLCEHLKIDLGRAILDKMQYNRTRPYKHGKAY